MLWMKTVLHSIRACGMVLWRIEPVVGVTEVDRAWGGEVTLEPPTSEIAAGEEEDEKLTERDAFTAPPVDGVDARSRLTGGAISTLVPALSTPLPPGRGGVVAPSPNFCF